MLCNLKLKNGQIAKVGEQNLDSAKPFVSIFLNGEETICPIFTDEFNYYYFQFQGNNYYFDELNPFPEEQFKI